MVVFKSIKPGKPFQSSRFRAQMRAAAEKMRPQITADFDKTTATWKPEDKPAFKSAVNVGSAAGGRLAKVVTGSSTGVSIEVLTDSAIYGYLDEGTRVRYATMTPDFQPKTRPRRIASYRGRGGVAYIDRRRPRPGIKAREFSKTIREKWHSRFREHMQAAVDKAARESGHLFK